MSVFRPCPAAKFPFILLILGLATAGWRPAGARDWEVPAQAPTIQAAVDSCVSGDVVVIAPGIYDDCTHPNGNNVLHIAVLVPGVSLRGETGDPGDVILDAGRLGRCLELRNCSGEITIEGVTLRRGKAVDPYGSGGGVFIYNSWPVFRSCVFDSCQASFAGGAINVSYGGLTLEGCVFTHNGTANIGGAVRATSSPLTVTGCTVYGTTGAGIHYATTAPAITGTIITGGDDAAIVRNLESNPAPAISCTDIFGNQENWTAFIASKLGEDGNLEADPLFCNPLFGDLTLHAVSPCAPENAGVCGLIGARGVVCGLGAAVLVVRPDGSGDFPTIQAAINAAADGDTVALAAGTFTGDGNRDLDFLGKRICVKGQAGDPDQAVIDCQGSLAEPHRGFRFHSGENELSVLRDLTLTNANITGDGAAVLCESSPSIIGCVFFQNHADRGAGVFCDGGSPAITGCTFVENEGRARAGGIGLFGSRAVITDCLFTRNWGYMGSAVFVPDSSQVTVQGCTMTANNSSLDKACIGVDGNASLTLLRTQVTFGNRRAVRCYASASMDAQECNLYQNAEGDYTGCLAGALGLDGNLSLDPLYCDAAADDFHLRSDSSGAPHNTASGLPIGAFGVGCQAPPVFIPVTGGLPQVLAQSGGVTWTDWNGDGWLDLFVANRDAANELLNGSGGGVFTAAGDTAAEFTGQSIGSAWADWDNDGDEDLYLINDGQLNILMANQRADFEPVYLPAVQAGGPAAGCAWADYDNDGHLDLYLAEGDTTGILLRSDGAGGFTAVADTALAKVTGAVQAVWADYDGDGRRDLYVVQDGSANQLFHNTGAFNQAGIGAVDHPGNGRGAAWGDFDNDGDLDLYLVNDGQANVLWRNRGGGDFAEVEGPAVADEGPGRSGIWGDWDNDGDLDLFIANCGAADRLLRNDGAWFTDLGDTLFAAADSSVGAAWGDWDNDGDLDLAVSDRAGPTRLYRNGSSAGRHWLKVDLFSWLGMKGCPGARVRVVTCDTLVQIREVGSSAGLWSGDPATVHFGLGAVTVIDTLTVTWPGGNWKQLTGVAADQLVQLQEGSPSAVPPGAAPTAAPMLRLWPCRPNPFNPATTLAFETARAGRVTVRVYDLAGRRVRTLLDEQMSPGRHQTVWRGSDDQGRTAAAGVYFLKVTCGGQMAVTRAMLVK